MSYFWATALTNKFKGEEKTEHITCITSDTGSDYKEN